MRINYFLKSIPWNKNYLFPINKTKAKIVVTRKQWSFYRLKRVICLLGNLLGTHEIIKIFNSVFSGIDLPACISLVDHNGLLIYTVGECADQWSLESLFSYLIMSFELTRDKLKLTDENLDSLVVTTKTKVFYIDDISGKFDLYMIIQTSPNLMNKVLPFLKNIVTSVEKNLEKA